MGLKITAPLLCLGKKPHSPPYSVEYGFFSLFFSFKLFGSRKRRDDLLGVLSTVRMLLRETTEQLTNSGILPK